MFFVLSKTLYYLVLPITILFILLVFTALSRKLRTKRNLIWITLICFYIFTNDFIANSLLKAWEMKPVPFKEITTEYDYGIVLTGVLSNEQTPKDRPYFNKGADRVFHTFQLYQKGIINKILISGGVGRLVEVEYKEAENMKRIFLTMGVPEEDLIIEGDSRNTAESAVNVSKMVNEEDRLLLITSAFHMRRAQDCFLKQNVPIDTFPVDFYTDPELTFDEYIIPTIYGLQKWTKLIQEVTGYIAYDLVGYI